jgi:hypothetical protein
MDPCAAKSSLEEKINRHQATCGSYFKELYHEGVGSPLAQHDTRLCAIEKLIKNHHIRTILISDNRGTAWRQKMPV